MINALNWDNDFIMHLLPLILMGIAIAWLMVAKIFNLAEHHAYVIAVAIVLVATYFGFNIDIASSSVHFGIHIDGISQIGLRLLLSTTVIISMLMFFRADFAHKIADIFLLLLISCFGGMVILISQNWILFFIGLQALSLPIYGLLAIDASKQHFVASSMRYLVLSFVAMAFLLFGILLLYAASGSLDLVAQGELMAKNSSSSSLFALGLALVMTGIGFKLSLFPFHVWAPEVYEGASLFVVNYLVIFVKGVVMLFLLRCTSIFLAQPTLLLLPLLSSMSIVSMWIGNGMMIRERRFSRFLAFLSVGHLGALVIALLSHHAFAAEAILLDIAAFSIAIIVVIAVIKSITPAHKSFTIDDLYGFSTHHPRLAVALTIALMSIAGMPLSAGFIGKYAIIKAGIASSLWPLTVHLALSSLLAAVGITKIILAMWSTSRTSPSLSYGYTKKIMPNFLIMSGALALLVLGIFPEPWIAWVRMASAPAQTKEFLSTHVVPNSSSSSH